MSSRSNKDNRGHGGRKPQHGSGQKRRSLTSVPGGDLPKWVRDEIQRSTPKDRRDPAINHLTKAVEAYADDRFTAALPDLRKAKDLAPRSSTVRELLGLAAYNSGKWDEALRELRTFRRISGDVIHMPVEMDCLRALERPRDVTKTWELLNDLEPKSVSNEARVVYASFLLDQGQPREAWKVAKPGRLIAAPSPGELRRWFVAARAAIAADDKDAARRIIAALDEQELDFEGVDDLRAAVT